MEETKTPTTAERTFCESHWKSMEHGPETTRMDAFDRPCIFKPEGELCSFCPDPAAYRAAVAVVEAEIVAEATPEPDPSTEPEGAA